MKITNDWQVSHGEDHTSEPPGNSETIESPEIIDPPEHQPPSSLKGAVTLVFILLSLGLVMGWEGIQKRYQEAKRRNEFIASLEMQLGDLQLRDHCAEIEEGVLSVSFSMQGVPVGKSSGINLKDYSLDYSLAVIVGNKTVHESQWKTEPTTAMFMGSLAFPHFRTVKEYVENDASIHLSIKQNDRPILSTTVPIQEKPVRELDYPGREKQAYRKKNTQSPYLDEMDGFLLGTMGFFRFRNPVGGTHFKAKKLTAEGKLDEAILAYTDALEVAPLYLPAYVERGEAYHKTFQVEKAKSDYLEAVRLSDARADTCARLIPFLQYGEVETLVEPLLSDKATVNFYNHLAFEYATCSSRTHRNSSKALEFAFKACYQAGTPSLENYKTLAAAHAENKDFKEAIRVLEEAIEATEEYPWPKGDLAQRQELPKLIAQFKEEKPIRRKVHYSLKKTENQTDASE
ncbi:MAG: tetratricopeptide repeat protein [Rubripirellula sp.]